MDSLEKLKFQKPILPHECITAVVNLQIIISYDSFGVFSQVTQRRTTTMKYIRLMTLKEVEETVNNLEFHAIKVGHTVTL